jgi:hypothetical protein
MTDDRADQPDTIKEGDSPSARQLLHAATGDREAEAKALADRSEAEVGEADAAAAIQRAHGDVHDEPRPENDVASPEDAKVVREEEARSSG